MRAPRHTLHVAIVLLLGAGGFAATAQSPALSGYVFGVRGRWSANNPYVPELRLGQTIYAGQVIQLVDKTDHSFINVGYVDNSAALLDCDKDLKGCGEPFKVKTLAAGPTTVERLRTAWSRVFIHGQVPVVFAMARSGDTKGPQEAVLLLDMYKLDPSAALRNLDAGKYTLAFRTPSDDSASPVSLSCEWKPPAVQCSTASRLSAGLFKLSVFSDGVSAGSQVAVLLAPPARFDALTRTFEEWKSATQAWERDFRVESVHYFRTAALDALSQTSGP